MVRWAIYIDGWTEDKFVFDTEAEAMEWWAAALVPGINSDDIVERLERGVVLPVACYENGQPKGYCVEWLAEAQKDGGVVLWQWRK